MLKEKIIFLIENEIDTFLSGGMGEFDRVAAHKVHRLKKQYSHIKNKLVIAYLNAKIDDKEIYDEIVFPEGQEFCHYKTAIYDSTNLPVRIFKKRKDKVFFWKRNE